MSSGSSPITSRPRLVEFTNRFVQPPTPLYIDRDDRLYVEFATTAPLIEFHIGARILNPAAAGGVIHQQFDLAAPLDVSPWFFQAFPLPEGFLLGTSVIPKTLVLGPGALYVLVGLLRGTEARQSATQHLCAGYVVGPSGPTWPYGRVDSTLEGPGLVAVALTSDPAAGAEISFTVPPRRRQQLHSMRFQLITDATAANRRVRIQISRAGVVLWRSSAVDAQTASQTIDYNAAVWGVESGVRDSQQMLALPHPLLLEEDDVIATATANLQAGDNLSQASLGLESWLADT